MKNILNILIILLLTSCSAKIEIDKLIDDDVNIYPDYKAVTIPCNIAPINFAIVDSIKIDALLIITENDTLTIDVSDNCTKIDIEQWHKFLADKANSTLTFTLCQKRGNKYAAYKPFYVFVSPDSIDKTLVYRLIPPGYEIWNKMGIYQRNLETYSQTAIYENRYGRGNCVNCHSFCNRSPELMTFHLRARNAGTYIYCNKKIGKIKTDFTGHLSNPTYPYWHPSGRYIAYSLNKIFQDFHTVDNNIIEVYDEASDVIVYDVENEKIIDSPLICSSNAFETFPCFSPDGNYLYFCSAQFVDSVRYNFKDVHYNICRIAFENGKFGDKIDTIFNAASDSLSALFPRISPNGKYLLFTLSNYGNFSIWHNEADLKMIDISTSDTIDINIVNSDRTESYHSWSSNSHWIVFSSRRDDGLYTRPYFAHIDENGNASKPMLLPQENPLKYYQQLYYSYNIPELVKSEVNLSARKTDLFTRQLSK